MEKLPEKGKHNNDKCHYIKIIISYFQSSQRTREHLKKLFVNESVCLCCLIPAFISPLDNSADQDQPSSMEEEKVRIFITNSEAKMTEALFYTVKTIKII